MIFRKKKRQEKEQTKNDEPKFNNGGLWEIKKETNKEFFQKLLLKTAFKKFIHLKLPETNALRVVLIGEHENTELKYRFKTGTFPTKIKVGENEEFTFSKKALFKDKFFIPMGTWYKSLNNIRNFYVVHFNRKTKDPIILKDAGEKNGHLLFMASRTKSYSNALTEFVDTKISGNFKYILLGAIAIGIIIAIIYFYPQLTGSVTPTPQIPTPTPFDYPPPK